MRVDTGRIPSRKILILIGLVIGSLIVLPISIMNHNIPVGMFGSVLLGMPIALSLQRTYGYDVKVSNRKKYRIGSYIMMGAGILLFILGISRMLIGSF
jgi:hypothetical protein